MVKILVAESNDFMRLGLRVFIENQPSLQLEGESNTFDIILDLANKIKPDIILFDLLLDSSNTTEQITRLLYASSQSKILVLTSNQNKQTSSVTLHQNLINRFLLRKQSWLTPYHL